MDRISDINLVPTIPVLPSFHLSWQKDRMRAYETEQVNEDGASSVAVQHYDKVAGDAGQVLAVSLASLLEASGCLVGPAVFKTVEGVQTPWRVRFPSASAMLDKARDCAPSACVHTERWRCKTDSCTDSTPKTCLSATSAAASGEARSGWPDK